MLTTGSKNLKKEKENYNVIHRVFTLGNVGGGPTHVGV